MSLAIRPSFRSLSPGLAGARAWRLAAVAAGLLGTAVLAQAAPHSCKRVEQDQLLKPGVTPMDFASKGLQGSAPVQLGGGLSYTTYSYGSVSWREPSVHCILVGQTFDLFQGKGKASKNRPTIVYFHGNGSTSHISNTSPTYVNLVQPAVKAGYNVASVEYRHPVTDQYLAQWDGIVPTLDSAYAIQFLRANAPALHISQNNLFSFGHSRGTVALWQALQPDMGGGNTGLPSSLPQAYYGFGPQTTYQCDQFSTMFLVQDADSAAEVQSCKEANTYWSQFGSAVDSVTALAPPVHLQTDGLFVLEQGTNDQIRLLTYPEFIAEGFATGHYPDYAIALLDAYERVGNTKMDYPEHSVDAKKAFVGWQAFITPLVQKDKPAKPTLTSAN